MSTRTLFTVIVLALLVARPALARQDEPKSEPRPIPDEQASVTKHTVVVDGTTVAYTATAATMHLLSDDGDVTGNLYYTAYTKDGANPGTRPISFIYNGGPGSASMWLHMGAFGPRRIVVDDSESTPPPPYGMEDNPGTLIDVTDMVFVDPIGTGFSRVVGEGEGKDYWGVDEDAKSLTQFVTRYVTRNRRWNSPKFLIGESYGTTRSAVLVNRLQGRAGMQFNGVVLISSVLDFETLMFNPGQDVSYITFLPTYAITAAYHGVIPWPDDLEAWLDEVRAFATGDYAHVLARGAAAPRDQVERVRARLAAYTGLPEDYLERARLRVGASQLRAELERTGGRVVSRLDARYKGFTNALLSENAPYDPQSTAISGAYTAAINRYLREDLGFETEEMYQTGGGTSDWNWDRAGSSGGWQGATYVAGDLEQAMIRNPHLKVEFENGYFDLATPFFASEWTTDHMNLPDELRANITHKYYEAGHMMYVIEEELMNLRRNVAGFIRSAAAPPVE